MRITYNALVETTLRNLNKTMERLDRLQDQLTSGQRISAPSHDPVGVAAAMEFKCGLLEIEQFIKNADSAQSWLEATDSALDSVSAVLQRARELAVQAANGTTSQIDKQAMAREVSALLDQAVALGNSTYSGQYLFAGFKIDAAPFSLVSGPPTTVVNAGDDGQIARLVDRQATIVVNISGSSAFDQVFAALIGLRDDLNNGDSSAVSARLADLDSAIDSVVTIRSEVGARINRVGNQKDRLENLRVNIIGLLSKTQDVDMAEAITQFAMQQNVYKAALGAGAQAIQPSLLDYLR